MKDKIITIVHIENGLRNNSFINWTQLTIHSCNFCSPTSSKTGSYGKQKQVSDKILVNHAFKKACYSSN